MNHSSKLPISAFIIACNEAHRIRGAIESVISLVDEVIVVDSGSTDDTVQVAQEAGAKVVYNPWPGYGKQKKFAQNLCHHDWILNLDADERLSHGLEEEIKKLFKTHTPQSLPFNGYVLRVLNVFRNKVRRLNYTTNCVRLYRKSFASFSESPVHDSVVFFDPKESIGHLKHPVYHFTVINFHELVQKLNDYSTDQAQDYCLKRNTPSLFRLLFEFPFSFIKFYLLRRLFLEGRYGFILAMLYAFQRFLRIAKIYEKQFNA